VYKKLARVRRVPVIRRTGPQPDKRRATTEQTRAAGHDPSPSVLISQLGDLDRFGQRSDVELEQPPATAAYPPRQQ